MGRKTYEFGYRFGLEPGQPAYPHMEHHIFSETLEIEQFTKIVHIEKIAIERIKEIVAASQTDVYSCRGGQFARWHLDNGLIDQLELKLNPILLGSGVRMYGNSTTALVSTLIEKESFGNGIQFLTYGLNWNYRFWISTANQENRSNTGYDLKYKYTSIHYRLSLARMPSLLEFSLKSRFFWHYTTPKSGHPPFEWCGQYVLQNLHRVWPPIEIILPAPLSV